MSLCRSMFVGLAATGADFAVLVALVQCRGWSPAAANVPALLLGAYLQFVGNKRFAFRDDKPAGAGQLGQFAAVEIGTLALNALTFQLLIVLTAIPYPLARITGSAAVYLLFSYPMWQRIFGTAAWSPPELPARHPTVTTAAESQPPANRTTIPHGQPNARSLVSTHSTGTAGACTGHGPTPSVK
jgi:putative flippase GtrA